ncbi:MAG: hypothetical protein ACBR50_15205 [Microcoleus sp.]
MIDRPLLLDQKSPIALYSSFSKKGDLSPQLNVGPIALLVTNVFAGKRDRPTYIPDAKPAIALLEGVKMCDRLFGMERSIAQHNLVKQHFEQRESLTIENYC